VPDSSSGRDQWRRIRRQRARGRAVGVAWLPRVWPQIDEARDPWFSRRVARMRFVPPANVSVLRSVPAETTAQSMPPNGPLSRARDVWRASVLWKLFAYGRSGPRAMPVQRPCAFAPTSSPSAAAGD
jgi:hypothetical protein